MVKPDKDPIDDLEGGTLEFLQLVGLAAVVMAISTLLYWFVQKSGEKQGDPVVERAQRDRPGVGNRRAGQVRNRRGLGRRVDDSESEGEGNNAERQAQFSDDDLEAKLNDPKLGAKKKAKLEAKAEKKKEREAEERFRQERKTKEANEQKERELREKEEADAEKKREAEEKRLREEKAQRELEEYTKMKEMFTVEGEGCEAPEDEDEGNLIEKFIEHCKAKKVILFEELATQFGLKVPDAIDRLTTLVTEGRLTGVMDDRGKFIYISEDELGKFAKFIKQRGRVSIADLVENSSSLITLVSEIQEDKDSSTSV